MIHMLDCKRIEKSAPLLTVVAVPLQPVYEALFGFHVFGLGFITSMGFIIGTGRSIPNGYPPS